jgi:nucleoid-associated protein EbfC
MTDQFDLGKLLAQAQEMQQRLLDAQAEAADAVFEGQAGGGAVTVSVTGGLAFQSVTIRPDAVDPDDVEMLEDLVLAAIRDAVAQMQVAQKGAMGDLGLGLDSGALGGLGGLLGGAP